MNEQRRKECIEWLESFDGSEESLGPFAYYNARDILAMLKERELPWKVWLNGEHIASFKLSGDAEEYIDSGDHWQGGYTPTITGPDAEDAPNPGTTAPSEGTPTITFKPYEPPRPTLDQMPEGEFHLCGVSGSNRVWVAWFGTTNKVYYEHADGGKGVIAAAIASELTVLDADPPPPETLADVPDLVLVEDVNGKLFSKYGGKAWARPKRNLLEYEWAGLAPHEVKITRVLGYPQFNPEGATNEQG